MQRVPAPAFQPAAGEALTLTHQIHVDQSTSSETATSSRKLMHRFNENDVQRLMDEVER
jgi:hypothetical protein